MVLTVSFVLSPVIGLSCHRRLADTSARLDASVEASGPYDFAVRVSAVRQKRICVHRIPCPTFVTIAKRPFVWAGDGGGCRADLGQKRTKIFLQTKLDIKSQTAPDGQIT
jgi:hypothetical protein